MDVFCLVVRFVTLLSSLLSDLLDELQLAVLNLLADLFSVERLAAERRVAPQTVAM